ncbi:MAG: hypothetical protein ABEI99_11230, partial [Halobaculum sp.]
ADPAWLEVGSRVEPSEAGLRERRTETSEASGAVIGVRQPEPRPPEHVRGTLVGWGGTRNAPAVGGNHSSIRTH